MQKPMLSLVGSAMEGKLIETLALTTKAEPPNIQKLLSQAKSRFPTFKTFEDTTLEHAIIEADKFIADIAARKEPRWLSLVGNSGTGKTFLASQVLQQANAFPWLSRINHSENGVLSPVRKVFWPRLLSQLRGGDYWLVEELARCAFVFLDEIAVEHDPSGFARDKLCEIISRRVRGWTVLTSNLTLEKLAEIDNRIASRMIRDGSVVVEMNTEDFSLR